MFGIGIVLAALAGAKMGGDAYWYSDEPKWKAMASSIGGGLVGAAAGYAMAPAAVAAPAATSATTTGTQAGVQAGAGVGTAVATQTGAELAKQSTIAATDPLITGVDEALLIAATESGKATAQTVGSEVIQTTAEQSAEALFEAQMLEAGKQTGMGSLEAMPQAGLDAANNTGTYLNTWEQLGTMYDQVGDLWNEYGDYAKDAMQVLDKMNSDEQQQQQGGMPSQTRGGLQEDQRAGMLEGMESNMDLFKRQYAGELQTGLSGAFNPLGETQGSEVSDISYNDQPTIFGLPEDPRVSGFDYNMLLNDSASDYNWSDTMFNF